MKKKELNSILSRKIALNIWNKIFFEKKVFNTEIDNNYDFNKLEQRDKSFIYKLLSLSIIN